MAAYLTICSPPPPAPFQAWEPWISILAPCSGRKHRDPLILAANKQSHATYLFFLSPYTGHTGPSMMNCLLLEWVVRP